MGFVAPMSIGDVAARTGLPPKTIRYYELIGLLPPAPRSPSGHRMYDAADIEMLRFISRARSFGFRTCEISSVLDLWRNRHRSAADVRALASKHIKNVDAKIAELTSLRHAVAELVERCQGDNRPDCPILDELAHGPDDRGTPRSRAHPAFSGPH